MLGIVQVIFFHLPEPLEGTETYQGVCNGEHLWHQLGLFGSMKGDDDEEGVASRKASGDMG